MFSPKLRQYYGSNRGNIIVPPTDNVVIPMRIAVWRAYTSNFSWQCYGFLATFGDLG
ncbi:MAG: hypothetical protein DSM106950_39930 [Stigonema ocellatum SAG 48.90 = DSM 106950]|nr:hypothetical protein [Stigonema ocellatum SAG 48.90 = DSM 106950]